MHLHGSPRGSMGLSGASKAVSRIAGAYNNGKTSKFIFLGAYFVAFGSCLVMLFLSFISLQRSVKANNLKDLRFPFSFAELKVLDETIMNLNNINPSAVFGFFATLYILKQSFSIPGSLILNLIGGRIYPVFIAFPLVCTLTMMGASSCYMLSKTFAKKLLMLCCSERIKATGKSMESHKSDLLWYMTFLRLVPMSPNWLINITAPIVGVPFGTFAASVFIGLMPYNFICVQAGSILSTVHSVDDIFTTWTMIKLGGLAVIAIIPIVVKRIMLRRQQRLNAEPLLPR